MAVDFGKRSGNISLTKGEIVTIEKSPLIRATCSWSSATDYDLYALVELRDGSILHVGTFPATGVTTQTSVLNGAVRHMGDVGRSNSGSAQEVIEIRMTDEIVAVYPVAYSAQSNGTGSFKQYNVSTAIENGLGDSVAVNASSASRNPLVFSVAIGAIRNTPAGVQIESLEDYSRMGNENRPKVEKGKLSMNKGERNAHK